MNNANIIISHPGITYGGLIYKKNLYGNRVGEIIRLIFDYYFKIGFDEIVYKVVPFIYHSLPAQDDIYFLNQIGAKNYRIDLSCTIDINQKKSLTMLRKRSLKKSQKYPQEIINGFNKIEECWELLKENLKKKYGAIPVHTSEEIQKLIKLFPNNISCIASKLNGDIIAFIILYKSANVWHTQYIAANNRGHQINALDFIFNASIEEAIKSKIRWFDFGTSNESNGKYLNNNLYNFKHGFGAGGTIYQFYKLTKMTFYENPA